MGPKKIFKYYGSKTYLLNDIYRLIEAIRDKVSCFVDVFGGSGVVALNLPFKFKVVVYNDIDLNLYKTFKVLQNKELREKLIEKLEYSFIHREIFEEFKESLNNENNNLDDVEIAFRFIYVANNSINGDMISFTISKGLRGTESRMRTILAIKKFQNVIDKWIVENRDFEDVMNRYDSERTIFYLDPPYIERKKYRHLFKDEDYYRLKKKLEEIKGFYILNHTADIEAINIFGKPNFIKSYRNYFNLQGIQDNREEGFWFNFDIKNNVKNIVSFLV